MDIHTILVVVAFSIFLVVEILVFMRMEKMSNKVMPAEVRNKYARLIRIVSIASPMFARSKISELDYPYFLEERNVFVFHLALLIMWPILIRGLTLLWESSLL